MRRNRESLTPFKPLFMYTHLSPTCDYDGDIRHMVYGILPLQRYNAIAPWPGILYYYYLFLFTLGNLANP